MYFDVARFVTAFFITQAGRRHPHAVRAGLLRGLHAAYQDTPGGGAGRPAEAHVQEAGRRRTGPEVGWLSSLSALL